MPCPLLTRCAAAAMAAAALGMSGLALAGPAAASQGTAREADGAPPVSLGITSVSPAFAQPGLPVTVSGTLTNSSSRPMTGLSVQLRSSSTPLGSRGELQAYADGNDLADSVVPGAVKTLPGTLRPGTTVNWSVVLPVSQVPMTTFGVYPLAAQAENASLAPLTVNRTFLPFWPGKKAPDPKPQQIAWIWPLIDQPRQALCAGLTDNGLASSIASGGRLAGLLDVGSSYATSAQLTWAIDPALLANVHTMTKPYRVGGTAGCHGVLQPASKTATAWLTKLKSATAGQPAFRHAVRGCGRRGPDPAQHERRSHSRLRPGPLAGQHHTGPGLQHPAPGRRHRHRGRELRGHRRDEHGPERNGLAG